MKSIRFIRHGRRTGLVMAGATLLLAGCGNDGPDAYGNFEADEVTVSSEVSGRVTGLLIREGGEVTAGAVTAQIDTVGLALQLQESRAGQAAAAARRREVLARTAVLEARLETARSELRRLERLAEAEAATARQPEQAQGQVAVLERELTATRVAAEAAAREEDGVAARLERLQDQLERTRVRSPVNGTVLRTFVEAGELVSPGRPLYTVARLDTLTLRAYLGATQLAELRLGQQVEVRVDGSGSEGSLVSLDGRVTWISDEAEFTPTPIQTREERVNLVYAVDIEVANPDGRLRIGMPGELVLTPETPGAPERG